MELHGGITFSPKLAVYYDIIFRSCALAAVLVILVAYESPSVNKKIKHCPQKM